MKSLNEVLHAAIETTREKIPTAKAARVCLMQVAINHRRKGGSIKGWRRTIDMLLKEFYGVSFREAA